MATRTVQAAAVQPANSAKVTVENTDGVLTIRVNHGNADYAPRAWKDNKTNEMKQSDYGLIAEIGSRFGTLDIGDGFRLAMLFTKAGNQPARAAGNLTIVRK